MIDLKWSGARFRRAQLAAGTAHQLAAYAHLARDPSGAWPPVAFFILREQRLLTTDDTVFRDADRVDGPAIGSDVGGVRRRRMRRRRAALAAGMLEAPGLPRPTGRGASRRDDAIIDGVLVLAPPCGFCDLHTLCGLVFYGRLAG